MKQKFNRAVLLVCAVGELHTAFGADTVSRISREWVSMGAVQRLLVSPGLISVVQFPFPITEIKIGAPEQVFAQMSKSMPSELTISLRRSDAHATNVIVHCGSRTFVFDIIPSRESHQDVLKIAGAYGEAGERGMVLIDSSDREKAER